MCTSISHTESNTESSMWKPVRGESVVRNGRLKGVQFCVHYSLGFLITFYPFKDALGVLLIEAGLSKNVWP